MALPACQPVNHGEDRSNSGLAKPPGPFVLYVCHADAAVVRVQELTLRQPFQYPIRVFSAHCTISDDTRKLLGGLGPHRVIVSGETQLNPKRRFAKGVGFIVRRELWAVLHVPAA